VNRALYSLTEQYSAANATLKRKLLKHCNSASLAILKFYSPAVFFFLIFSMQNGNNCDAIDPNLLARWGTHVSIYLSDAREKANTMFNGYFCKGTTLDPNLSASNESMCLSECSKSYTKDLAYWGNLKKCSSCSEGCKKCTSPNPSTCSSCLLGYRWDTHTSTCQKCFPTCLTCSGSRYN
jgi:hypothetical protein